MTPSRSLAILLVAGATAGCGSEPLHGAPVPDAGREAGREPRPEAPPPQEDVVRVRVGDRALVFRGAGQVKPECVGGHRGFSAWLDGDRLHMNGFLFEPGAYSCLDPISYVFFDWRGKDATGEYQISAAGPLGGPCQLTVESVHPRLKASFTASLPRASGEGPDQVVLTDGALDVAMPACP